MRLLVSVRSADEVRPAIEGGAQIIDAKEPSLGSLGAVSAAALEAIAAALPAGVPLSVALGDPADARAVAGTLALLDGLGSAPPEVYLKLGLASAGGFAAAEHLVGAVVEAASRASARPAVIVVAYADASAAGTPARDRLVRLAARAGSTGILLDTWAKDGRDLFRHVEGPALRRWVADAKQAGLLVALAGSLSAEGVRRVAGVPADVVGVRGAACVGGREGMVTEALVRRLRSVLEEALPRPEIVP
jgi:(5-formylfuran-3-yl)methyl phosphate synthase